MRVFLVSASLILLALATRVVAAEPTPKTESAPADLSATAKPQHTYLAQAISPYEPIYFLGTNSPVTGAKFQFSLAVRLIGRPDEPAPGSERRNGFYCSYSQTSLWNLEAESKPFFDSSYRPEGWWHQGGLPRDWLSASSVDVEFGFGHESNGQSGDLSRSLNHLFIRPMARWDLPHDWQIHLTPRLRYLAGLEDNDDLPRYRGIFDTGLDLGRDDGWKFATLTHIGTHLDRGSFQLDVSYPLVALTNGWLNCFAHVQWFSGWAESLRAYEERTNHVLIGISFVR